jgi:hypothetical protein
MRPGFPETTVDARTQLWWDSVMNMPAMTLTHPRAHEAAKNTFEKKKE